MANDEVSLWPREHGAYAQLAVALLCGGALGHGFRGVCQALLTVLVFLASEPVLVVLGRRGAAYRGSAQVRAALRLLILGSLVLLMAIWAWAGAPARQLASLLPPALLGSVLFALFLARLERTAAGEVMAAWTFATAAGAVAMLGGATPRQANLLVLFLAGQSTMATAIVHLHILALKKTSAWPRNVAALACLLLTLVAVWAGRKGGAPRLGYLAFLPMVLTGLWMRLAPPGPRQLKRVGWLATAAAVLGGALAVFMLWRG